MSQQVDRVNVDSPIIRHKQVTVVSLGNRVIPNPALTMLYGSV